MYHCPPIAINTTTTPTTTPLPPHSIPSCVSGINTTTTPTLNTYVCISYISPTTTPTTTTTPLPPHSIPSCVYQTLAPPLPPHSIPTYVYQVSPNGISPTTTTTKPPPPLPHHYSHTQYLYMYPQLCNALLYGRDHPTVPFTRSLLYTHIHTIICDSLLRK